MHELSPEGQRLADDLARRHGIAADAVVQLLVAAAATGGRMMQFNHPALGGLGQWSQGGMSMIGDMFNSGLKARVDALCAEVADIVARQGLAVPAQTQSQSPGGGRMPGGGQMQMPGGGQMQVQGGGGLFAATGDGGASLFVPGSADAWWPADLGQPSSAGQQNSLRYAIFPEALRLAIDVGGRVQVHDTLDHRITGIGQQQGEGQSLSFTSQHGLVRLADLPRVDEAGVAAPVDRAATAAPPAAAPKAPPPPPPAPHPAPHPAPAPASAAAGMTAAAVAAASPPPPPRAAPASAAASGEAVLAMLERLAELHGRGILSDDEFSAKKAELLARL